MKKENKLKISFIGGNSYDVTGSMILIEWNKRKILLDSGLIQGGTTLQDYKDNRAMLTKNKLKDIEFLFVGERHIDHTGNIPYITKLNPNCRIITPIKTKKILKCMLEDSANIAERDCECLSKKYSKSYYPNYTLDDVQKCLDKIEEYNVGEKIIVDDDITIKFSYSNHIFGCCQMELWINVNNKIKHLLYTADLGNILNSKNRPFTEDFMKVNNANIVISESTYGLRDNYNCTSKTIEKDIEKIYSTIEQYVIDKNNRVLIPTFSLDRTPAMLYLLWKKYKDDERFKDIKILVDSPLSNKLLDIYVEELEEEKSELLKNILSWNNIIRITESEDSKYAMENYKNCIIIASSGMCSQGRSKNWLTKIISNPNDCILFSGYCSENTLGNKIKNNKQKYITIDGKSYCNKCNIVNIKGQSSHMQRNELINYLKSINCEKIYLVHGSQKARIDLAEDLRKELQNCNKTSKVVIVTKGTTCSF